MVFLDEIDPRQSNGEGKRKSQTYICNVPLLFGHEGTRKRVFAVHDTVMRLILTFNLPLQAHNRQTFDILFHDKAFLKGK